MTIRRYLVLAAVTLFASIGDLCLKMGMNQAPSVTLAHLDQAILSVLNPWVAIGILFLLCFFACYLTALSWADLTFVLPATAIGYVIVPIFSVVILHEHVTLGRWIGIALIAAGVGFVTRGPSRTIPEPTGQPAMSAKFPGHQHSGEERHA